MAADRARPVERWPGAAFLLALGCAAAALALWRGDLVDIADPDAPFYRSPDFFPGLTLAIAAIGALVMAGRHVLSGPAAADDALPRSRPRAATVVAVSALFALYIGAVPWLGYPLSTLAFAALALAVAGVPRRLVLILPLLIAATLWLVFAVLLGVWFPEPAMLELVAGD